VQQRGVNGGTRAPARNIVDARVEALVANAVEVAPKPRRTK